MYYPYLRGKQFELILLRDNAQFLATNNIHPIIEPVKSDFSALERAMKAMNEKESKCTLIVNPQAGLEPVPARTIIKQLFDGVFKKYKNIFIGYILHAETKISELVDLVNKYSDFNFSIIHCGFTDGKGASDSLSKYENIKNHIFIEGFAGKLYQKHFKKPGIYRILIRNGFKQQKKNAHYPPSEHFSDLHITYEDEGMNGFGDYLIAGDDYSETGGPAWAVAIHITYLNDEKDMFIYHFISDQTDSPTDPGGKFLEALEKLVAEISKPKSLIFKSDACKEFLDLFDKKHYPGLGYVKKISLQHHIELMVEYFDSLK